MSLSRDQILAAQDRALVEVNVPEWGGAVYMRTASVREWDQAVQAARIDDDRIDGVKYAAAVVAVCLCDEKGDKIFSIEDIAVIEGKSRVVVQRLFDRAQTLNGFNREGQAELEGNSKTAVEGSSSD